MCSGAGCRYTVEHCTGLHFVPASGTPARGLARPWPGPMRTLFVQARPGPDPVGSPEPVLGAVADAVRGMASAKTECGRKRVSATLSSFKNSLSAA